MKKWIRVFLSIVLAVNCIFAEISNADEQKFVLYTVKPISNKRILPETRYIPGKISDTLSIVAMLGEYEPASFVLRAKEDIEDLTFKTADFRNDSGEIIPSSSIDIKVVKCWYQDKGKNYQEYTPSTTYNPLPLAHKKVLVPELLLNDDSLIKVDTQEKHNYVKVSDNGEVKYVIISSEKKGEGLSGSPAIPVADSPHLLPVDIKADTNKQFWVTVKVPADAGAGMYISEVKFKTEQETLGALKLKLRVLPFKLSEPYEISSMYYYLPNKQFYGDKVMEQFKKEMENMYIHGVTNPPVHYIPGGVDNLGAFLKIRNQVGMNSKTLFYSGIDTGNPTCPEKLRALKEKVKKAIEIARPYGIEEVYVYGIDEALCVRRKLGHKGPKDAIERFTSQRPAWEAVHEAGGKIFVAGLKVNHCDDERRGGNFGFMGDIQDLMVAYGYPNREEAVNWHSKGHKIVCYANPQGGIEQPETYRRNFGLLLWQYDYDGAMTYIYHWEWGDFCRPTYKQHNMVYPTIDGVIDTIQWEGYREGVDDVRYLNTLIETMKKVEKSEDEEIQKVVKEVNRYLPRLKASDVNKTRRNLDTIRSEIIDFILRLTGQENKSA